MRILQYLSLFLFATLFFFSCNLSSQTSGETLIADSIKQHDEIWGECRKAKEVGTQSAFNNFIQKYPTTKFADTLINLRNLLDTLLSDEKLKAKQLKKENVQIAYAEKEETVKKLLADKNIDYKTLETFIRVIKSEQILEIWAKDRRENHKYQLVKTYEFCITKNPDKRRGIDLLVPESFYYIAYFYPGNPYFLRLEVNFPNESDKKRGRTGGDIAIHGGCFSTYCTPFTDELIKEIYIFAIEAKIKGMPEVPVHNFPFRMTDENFKKYSNDSKYKDDEKRIALWKNMKDNYQYFEKNKQLHDFTTDKKGKYIYKVKNEK